MPSISDLLKRTILKAKSEDRLVIGLINSIDYLYSTEPNKVLAVALTDSSSNRLSQTILETYCFENGIPFIKTESKILKRLMVFFGCHYQDDSCCVVITKPSMDMPSNYQEEIDLINIICENDEPMVVLHSPTTPPNKLFEV